MSGAVEGVALAERLRAAVTYQYMPMSVRKLLSEAAEALTTPPARSYADGVRDAAAVVDAEYDLRKHHHAANKAAGNKKEARDFETMMIAHTQSAAAIRLLSQEGKA